MRRSITTLTKHVHRYSLCFKKLEFTTVWVNLPDIKALYEKHGIPASSTNPDGSPYYTVPLIHDLSTGAVVSESLVIAKYLDAAYPDAPKLLPLGGEESFVLHKVWVDVVRGKLAGLLPYIFPWAGTKMTPVNLAYVRDRPRQLGAPAPVVKTDEQRAEEWGKVKASLEELDRWYGGKQFVVGDTMSFADIQVGVWFVWMTKAIGEESQEWKDVAAWNGGRWRKLVEGLKALE